MMRIVDVLYALPSIVFVIVLLTALNGILDRFQARGWSGETARSVSCSGCLSAGAISWLTMARIVRGEVLSLRTRPFVEASRAWGRTRADSLAAHPTVLLAL